MPPDQPEPVFQIQPPTGRGRGSLPSQPEHRNFRQDFRRGFSSMIKTATKPNHDYQHFMAYHRRGFHDAIDGQPKSKHFVDLVCERGYLAGRAMAQLTQVLRSYYGQHDYWTVWDSGKDDEFRGRPYENPYPLKSWKHLAYLSGVRACKYCCAD